MFVTDDGLLALIDLGMIGRISPQMQERLLKLLLAISEGRGEEAADVAVTLGEKLPDFNEPASGATSPRWSAASATSRSPSSRSAACSSSCRALINDNAMRAPAELTMLGKTLLHLDEVGARARSGRSTSTKRSAATAST